MKKIMFLIYGVFSYFLFFGTVLYMMGFMVNFLVPKTIDSGVEMPLLTAFAVNLFWILLFGLQHTIMARPGFKERWTKIVPKPIERSSYVLISSLIMIGMFYFWQPMTGVIWSMESAMSTYAMYGFYMTGWVILFASTFIINHFDLFGLKQVYFNFAGKTEGKPKFEVKFLYKLCRHPLMLGWVMLFWATPVMTVGHLLFAAGMTVYILVALKYEEDDLVDLFGDEYRNYQQEVPKLCPFTKAKKRKVKV